MYEYLAWGPMYLELRLTPPVELRYAEMAFGRFRGWVLRTLRPHYPGASFQPHTLKPGGQHLHSQWRRLNMHHSGHGHAAVEFTSISAHSDFAFARPPRLSSSFWTVSGHQSRMICFADLVIVKHHLGALMTIKSRLPCASLLRRPFGERPHVHLSFLLCAAHWRMLPRAGDDVPVGGTPYMEVLCLP